MKKIILILITLIGTKVQSQVVSIVPNIGNYGQTLTTTITLANGALTIGSGPVQNGDIYLRKGNTVIYATSFQTYPPLPPLSDSLTATFTIPVVTPPGLYDVHVENWVMNPFPQQMDNVLVNGFSIGNVAGTISGKVYFDTNSNGVNDPGEHGYPNVQVNLSPSNWTTLTDTGGNYSFTVDTGSFSVSINPPAPLTQTSSPTSYSVTIPGSSSANDFGIFAPIPSPLTQQFSIYTHDMRCISIGHSGWNITNLTGAIETGSITVIHSPNLSFYYSTIAPTDSSSGDTITWDYQIGPMASLNSYVYYHNPVAGDTVWYVVIDSVFDINGVFQSVYTDSYDFIVSCSVDPNDKSVTPQADDASHLTLKSSDLTFTIRFQNTGTDTAYNVLVIDSIDTDLDLNTFQVLASSDMMTTTIDANRTAHFKFDNIMLPDSNVDEPNSHGFIMYKIHANANVPDSTVINNTAEIYFDFNAAVVTNTTLNTLVTSFPTAIEPMARETNSTIVYPNPVTNVSTLLLPSPGTYEMVIYNSNGNKVISKTVSENYKISNSKLAPGLYYYQLVSNGKTYSGKFLVVK